jgi:hypothetical protein
MRAKDQDDFEDVASDTLWGVPAIAKFIGRSVRQTRWLIHKNVVPATKRGAKTITGSRAEIRKTFLSSADRG